jgi:hypothetical protein
MAPDATIGSMYGSGPTRSFLGIPACEVLTPLEADASLMLETCRGMKMRP